MKPQVFDSYEGSVNTPWGKCKGAVHGGPKTAASLLFASKSLWRVVNITLLMFKGQLCQHSLLVTKNPLDAI